MILFKRRLHLPTFRTKMKPSKSHPEVRYTTILVTLNNVSRWIRWSKADIKNSYKKSLKEMYIPEPEMIYDVLTIDYRLIRHNNTRLDKDNIVFALKWLADSLEEMGYIKDDKIVDFKSFATIVDKNNSETMFEIRVHTNEEEW